MSYDNGKYKKSLENAKSGDSYAQYDVGDCYMHGTGVEKDFVKAFEWYKASADQGNPYALEKLGNCYYNGTGTVQDYKRAFELFLKSYESGNLYASGNIAKCYESGNGVEQDGSEAFKWEKIDYNISHPENDSVQVPFHYEHKVREDYKTIKEVLKNNGINYFYHFTDLENYCSILDFGGLYSWWNCNKNKIIIPKPGGGDLSRSLDFKYGLQNYVRLCFNTNHPMAEKLKKKGYNIIFFKVAIDVAFWEDVEYSNINATDSNHILSKNLNVINFNALKQGYTDYTDINFKLNQAEILVKDFIPCKYIVFDSAL